MTATATHRVVEVVTHVVEAEGRGRETTTEPGHNGMTDVMWADNGYWSSVSYKIDGPTMIIVRESKGGYVYLDLAAARTRTVPVFVMGGRGRGIVVAAFGDSPRAYPEITDLGWFTRTDQFTAQRWACDTLADVAVELAFLHLS